MARTSPLESMHAAWRAREAERVPAVSPAERPGAAVGAAHPSTAIDYLPYGDGDAAVPVPGAFGPVELEYAALRRGAALMDAPNRGVVRVSGADRVDFLDRLLTQAMKDALPGAVRCGFLLTRQGRIVADLTVAFLADAALIDVDVHQARAVAGALDAVLFTEDVAIEDASERLHRLTLLGRRAPDVLAPLGIETPESMHALRVEIAGAECVMARVDAIGEPGFELFVPVDDAPAIATALLEADSDFPRHPCGWYAWNVARVEHGHPMFNIDFGSTSLPHESGLLDERVSFRKGCYPGQEVVARIQNLGQPKQVIVGLQVRGDVLPVEGGPVHAQEEGGAVGPPVGVVTSSTLSPMLGRMPIALATVQRDHAAIGASVLVSSEGEMVEAVVAARPLWVRPPDAE